MASFDAAAERPETWLNRGLFELNRGQLEAAEDAYRHALRLEPRFVGAAVNLADLYRALGREKEGREVLEALLAVEANAASGHHSLGLLLVRMGERELALEHLEKAARYAPEDPRFSFVHAVALNDANQPSLAASALEQALLRHPGDFDLRSFYANLLLDQGQKSAAQEQARILQQMFPQDRRVEALLEATRD
jgi:tetratricopeptide (TPR) repeat protein